MVFADQVPLAREIEIAALKSIMLTFDHVLRGEPRCFTRSVALAPVREFVRRIVLDRQPPNWEDMNRYVLGLQYDRLPQIRAMRQRASTHRTPFEHVLIASGKTGTRTLDAAWLVADSDPQAFRLSVDWRAYDFTCIVVMDIVEGGTTRGPFWWEGDGMVLPYTNLRSHPSLGGSREAVQQQMEQLVGAVADHRREAVRQAVDYVERHCDEFVRENLGRLTRLSGEPDVPRRVADGLVFRLNRMFHQRLVNAPDKAALCTDIVKKHLRALPEAVGMETIDPGDKVGANVTWPMWLALERAILDELREPLGLPGDIITRSITAVADVPGERPIGMPPPV